LSLWRNGFATGTRKKRRGLERGAGLSRKREAAHSAARVAANDDFGLS